jgi:hypothetical protein
MKTRRANQASVLVIVLVTIVFTTTALLVLIERASDDLLLPVRDADARRLRVEAYSALETTLAVLEEFRAVNGALRSPAEGWSDPLEFAGYTPAGNRVVTVSFEDESGKISLPKADEKRFKEVFKAWDIDAITTEKLTDSLLTWMQPEFNSTTAGVTRVEDYAREVNLPFKPPARSLRAWSELAAIDGVRELFFEEDGTLNALGQRFTAAFSLYEFDTPNVNAALPDTLLVLGEYDDLQRTRIGDFVSGKGVYASKGAAFFKDPAEVSNVASGSSARADFGVAISALWVTVTVVEGRGVFQLRALVAPPEGAKVASPKQPTDAPPPPNPPNPPRTQATNAAPLAPSLNYPFTVLEIRENDSSALAASVGASP